MLFRNSSLVSRNALAN